jgi:hypothetical protein
MFLKISGMIEGQLRDAYDKKFRDGQINQSSLAAKLGVNRSAIHHRLSGRTNMTIETIADMVWGLGQDIEVRIFDPAVTKKNDHIATNTPSAVSASVIPPTGVNKPAANAIPVSSATLGTAKLPNFFVPAAS